MMPPCQIFSPSFLQTVSLCLLLACTAFAQHEAPKPVHATVEKYGWSDRGELVLSVIIYADIADFLFSTRRPGESAVDSKTGIYQPAPFSMTGAWLVEAHGGQKIPALADLPNKPFYGPMSGETILRKGDYLRFGVAFPPFSPLPPDARKQGYKLLLYLPLDAKPVILKIPAQ